MYFNGYWEHVIWDVPHNWLQKITMSWHLCWKDQLEHLQQALYVCVDICCVYVCVEPIRQVMIEETLIKDIIEFLVIWYLLSAT
jgi:hypothetical protein